MYKISATQWIFGKEALSRTLERLKKYGYDGIELTGDPELFSDPNVPALLQDYGLECTSICGIYTAERNLSSMHEEVRNQAVQYVQDCVDLAARVGASCVIVVPSPVGLLSPDGEAEEAWKAAVRSLKECGLYAESKGIWLALEALNRYETHLINRLEAGLELIKQTGSSNVKLMADVFHMNLEERDICGTLRAIAPELVHVHLAENTREAPGVGSMNFQAILATLREIGYSGALTMEFMPPASNPYAVAQQRQEHTSQLDSFAEQAINHIKSIVG
ncbi:sugar phosphate isomerase/epimerase family protein [Paenibacillus radicis (ex Xue et al. 2023)]|uniref:Sugar phosphate isomerase/epimerase n=1 Tax=Paenibacillus radicis (ex Xue et al. 2023) TaxID=2972489 RepID=A0ABT1YI47_9BACL|nr:sugar phosphate isomerase/epimerase family protein [Paenibacillus radicis (ex Xue et al. 2023)]MCR8632652.1 sugar phosphate isomerase/epimerase [Paenibacillus radicis (ex Xue et al. 2023)]